MRPRPLALTVAAGLWLAAGPVAGQDRAVARPTVPATGFHAAHAEALSRRPSTTGAADWAYVGCAAIPQGGPAQDVAWTPIPAPEKQASRPPAD